MTIINHAQCTKNPEHLIIQHLSDCIDFGLEANISSRINYKKVTTIIQCSMFIVQKEDPRHLYPLLRTHLYVYPQMC